MEVRSADEGMVIGRIPPNWRLARLGEICTFENGDRGSNYPSPGSFVPSGVPFVNAGNVSEGAIDLQDMNYITPEAYSRLGGGKLKAGDILFCLRGSLGKWGVVADDFGDGAIASSLVIVRPRSATASGDYIGCYFNSHLCAQMIQVLSGGAAQPNLGAQDLAKFLIPLPPTDTEQRIIAAALGDVDTLLDGLDRLIAKKRDLKQAAMQQLLTGRTRLPGFHGEWDVETLSRIVSAPITDGPHLTPIFLPVGVPFLSVNNLVDNRLDMQSLRYISHEDHEAFSKKCRPQRGDILFGKAASVGAVALIETDLELNIWSPLALIRPGSRAEARYVLYALQTPAIRRQISLLTNTSSQGNIGMGDIGRLSMPLPPRDEQAAIAAVLSDMDAEIDALKARRDKTHDLKQAMMQELLTGKTRLVPTGDDHG